MIAFHSGNALATVCEIVPSRGMNGSVEVSCCSTESVRVARILNPNEPASSLRPNDDMGSFQSTDRSTPFSDSAERFSVVVCTPVTPKLLGSRPKSEQNWLLGSKVGLASNWLKQRPMMELDDSDEITSSIS